MLELVTNRPIVPVIEIDNADHAVPLARALVAGGIDIIEVTFRTDAAADAMAAIIADVPEMVVGAGTVVTKDQVKHALDLGVAFGVAPGLNPQTVAAFNEAGTPFMPGVSTATEIEQGLSVGCKAMKFFPAEAVGGVPAIKAISGPYAGIGVRFCPTGGVNLGNMLDYLALPTVMCIGGSWVATRQQIASADWDGITARATEALSKARSV